jgi:hypothetical protein
MTDWIKNLADEEKHREEETSRQAKESSKILSLSSYILEQLIHAIESYVGQLNKQFYNGAKVFEITNNMGRFLNQEDNFVVMTQDFPAAYMWVKLEGYNRVIRRKLETLKNMEAKPKIEVLSEIRITLDAQENPVFIDGDHIIGIDEVSRLLIEPVYKAHKEN